ncbi:inactive pancreatic lipase-related protein 1-like [Diadema setosum]|uniref:inactive pancreatic lipase-related protein 1-like n=1 Tax=Diadema setosum TaxID=31175 RepID=UPI003B3B3977
MTRRSLLTLLRQHTPHNLESALTVVLSVALYVSIGSTIVSEMHLVSDILDLLQISSHQNVCYEDGLCLQATSPGCHHRLPQSPEAINTRFKLFTRDTRETAAGESLCPFDPLSIHSSCFDPSKETKIAIHGFRDTAVYPLWVRLRTALLNADDVNVILVDWSDSAFTFDYGQSRADIRVVGLLVARLVEMVCIETGAPFESIHLIGHSLGAHAAGYAGEASNQPLGRITGLDPASLGFSGSYGSPECRLDKQDALFVDVIHTSSGSLLGVGTREQLGHQDFYPNGGGNQPGCRGNPLNLYCDHLRAVELFTDSVAPSNTSTGHFQSKRQAATLQELESGKFRECNHDNPCPQMGYRADRRVGEGVFYLETNGAPPFSQKTCIQEEMNGTP